MNSGILGPSGVSKLLVNDNLSTPERPEDDYTVCLAIVIRFFRSPGHRYRALGGPDFQRRRSVALPAVGRTIGTDAAVRRCFDRPATQQLCRPYLPGDDTLPNLRHPG